jgi:hypothetical protein
MKKSRFAFLAVSGLLVAAAAPTFAQDPTELLRADLRAQKTAILTEAMDLDAAQSDVFWPIYREYEGEVIKLNDELLALIKDYGANYGAMTDEKAKELLKRGFKIRESRTSILKKYSGKMEKALSPTVAGRWVQCELAIQAAMDLQIASEVPLAR